MKIPKIIHQTAPNLKERWHPIWKECQFSWKVNYPSPEYKYILWDDNDCRELVKNKFSKYIEMYDSFPHDIMRIDFSRYCILYEYGGIYADMDIFCYENFYNELNKACYIVESHAKNEIMQNCLMISTAKNFVWKKIIQEIYKIYKTDIFKNYRYFDYEENEFINSKSNEMCLSVCGPIVISKLYEKDKNIKKEISILPSKEYNPPDIDSFFHNEYSQAIKKYRKLNENSEGIKCRHYLSGRWGRDLFECNRLSDCY